jgi:hypothetical protein
MSPAHKFTDFMLLYPLKSSTNMFFVFFITLVVGI